MDVGLELKRRGKKETEREREIDGETEGCLFLWFEMVIGEIKSRINI